MPSFSVRPTSTPTREVDRAEEAAVRAEVAAEKVGQTIDLATQLIKDVADAREEMIPITSQIETIPGVINAAVNTINNTRTEAVQSINASTEAAQEGISMQATGALSAISSQETSSRGAVMTAGMNELGNIAQAKTNALADISTAKTEAIEEIGDTEAITTALTEANSALEAVTDAIDEATEALAQIDGIEEKLSNLDDNGEIDASHVKSGSTSVAAKLSQIEEATSSLSPVNITWIQGYYGYSGNFNNADYRVTARDIITCSYGDIIRIDGIDGIGNVLWYSILAYDSNDNLLGYDNNFDSPIAYQNVAYVRINVGNTSSSVGTFAPSDMANTHVWVDSKNSRFSKIIEELVTSQDTNTASYVVITRKGNLRIIDFTGYSFSYKSSDVGTYKTMYTLPEDSRPIRNFTGTLIGGQLGVVGAFVNTSGVIQIVTTKAETEFYGQLVFIAS